MVMCVGSQELTVVQLRLEFLSPTPECFDEHLRPITLHRTFFAIHDMDTGEGGWQAELVQLGPQIHEAWPEHTATTQLSREERSWSQLAHKPRAFNVPEDWATVAALEEWTSPIFAASEYGVDSDNPIDPTAMTQMQQERTIVAMLEECQNFQLRFAIFGCTCAEAGCPGKNGIDMGLGLAHIQSTVACSNESKQCSPRHFVAPCFLIGRPLLHVQAAALGAISASLAPLAAIHAISHCRRLRHLVCRCDAPTMTLTLTCGIAQSAADPLPSPRIPLPTIMHTVTPIFYSLVTHRSSPLYRRTHSTSYFLDPFYRLTGPRFACSQCGQLARLAMLRWLPARQYTGAHWPSG